MVTVYHCRPGWQQMSHSKYTGGGLVIYILCIKTHRQIHRLAHLYITFTKDSDNTNPVVSTHGHDSIQLSVILLFPPLLVPPLGVLVEKRGNFSNLGSTFYPRLLALLLLSALSLFSTGTLWRFLVISGSGCVCWHSLALLFLFKNLRKNLYSKNLRKCSLAFILYFSWALCDVAVYCSGQKPQEKPSFKNLRKSLPVEQLTIFLSYFLKNLRKKPLF